MENVKYGLFTCRKHYTEGLKVWMKSWNCWIKLRSEFRKFLKKAKRPLKNRRMIMTRY